MGDTTADDAPEQQITFNIKSSSDQKFSVTVPASITIADLKQKLSTSEYANIPPERQRLIYSGRVLKDPDTVTACKIKEGNTIHLVKGAESNSRQNPANTGSTTSTGTPAIPQLPTNIAAGSGANNPLAQLTGARYAGMHGLPSMDMFGADGGMGAPPNSDQMLRLLDDPNFAQQMNEAMNNPAVIEMMRNNPMIRDNAFARAALDDPNMRRMMFNPQMLRMQMQMQRAMNGGGGDQGNFPMPGQTDTTQSTESAQAGTAPRNPAATPPNPFAALFPQQPAGEGASPANPFGSIFGAQGSGQNNYMQQLAAQMMGGNSEAGQNAQSPEHMNQLMQQFMGMGGAPSAPADDRPPEERYADQLRQLNDMGFYDFDRNVQALRRAGGSVQGAIEHLLSSL